MSTRGWYTIKPATHRKDTVCQSLAFPEALICANHWLWLPSHPHPDAAAEEVDAAALPPPPAAAAAEEAAAADPRPAAAAAEDTAAADPCPAAAAAAAEDVAAADSPPAAVAEDEAAAGIITRPLITQLKPCILPD